MVEGVVELLQQRNGRAVLNQVPVALETREGTEPQREDCRSLQSLEQNRSTPSVSLTLFGCQLPLPRGFAALLGGAFRSNS